MAVIYSNLLFCNRCQRGYAVAMTATDAIVVDGLTKRFGSTTALDKLNLRVKEGEVHGFLGPNGSGKSTTLRILLGLLRKNAGTTSMLSMDPWRDAVALHRRLAYVPGEVNLWPNLSGGEAIDLLGRLRGGLDPARRSDLIERFLLNPGKKISTYSKGNRQKVALIAALASPVELYLFDEPTSGLDPLMEGEFRECVNELRAQGATVLLSSHILAEVEALADRVTIIREGTTVETGSLADMRHLARTSVDVETEQPLTSLHSRAGIHGLSIKGNTAQFQVDRESLGATLNELAALNIKSLVSSPPTLEELFVRHYHSVPHANSEAE